MSNSIRTSALGLAAACTMALATITLVSAPAQAADCKAPAGESCLRITNNTKQIRSIRENKTHRCLTGIEPGQTREWSNISWNFSYHHMRFTNFTGRNCEGNTQFNAWDGTAWSAPDSRNYRSITIYNR
jgi:hypothetical protein